MYLTFTNVAVAMKTSAKEFSMTLLVANLENISICDFHILLLGRGDESLIVLDLHCFIMFLNGLRNILNFK